MFRPKTFAETIGPVLLMNVLLGIGCIAHVCERGARKSAKIVYFLVVISTMACIVVEQHRLCAIYVLPTSVDTNIVLFVAWNTCMYAIFVTLVVTTKFGNENIHDLIKTIEKVDEEMTTIGLPKEYSSQCKHQLITFFWLMAYQSLCIMLTWWTYFVINIPILIHIFLSAAINFVPILTMTGQLSFCVWIRYVRTKLSQLNCLLAEMIDVLDTPKSERLREIINGCPVEGRSGRHELRDNVEIIAKVKKYHLDWIKIARRINSFHGIHILATTSVSFLTILYLLYVLNYLILRQTDAVVSPSNIYAGLTALSLEVIRMIHLHSKCRKTSDEARKTGYLLCLLYDSSTTAEFRAEVQTFTQQVLENPLVFSICGFVDFDRSFLASLFGSACTYVFVILQLQTQNLLEGHLSNATASGNASLITA